MEWVAVTDRLPEEGKEVFVVIVGKEPWVTVEQIDYQDDASPWLSFGKDEISYWMPQQEPPAPPNEGVLSNVDRY